MLIAISEILNNFIFLHMQERIGLAEKEARIAYLRKKSGIVVGGEEEVSEVSQEVLKIDGGSGGGHLNLFAAEESAGVICSTFNNWISKETVYSFIQPLPFVVLVILRRVLLDIQRKIFAGLLKNSSIF